MLSSASGAGTLHLIPTLIQQSPPNYPSTLLAADLSGNTALHHASAAGELKALRLLLQLGANPLVSNAFSWTPVHYSATTAAEEYFKTLIIEFEKKKAEDKRAIAEREKQRHAGVRLVTDSEPLDDNGGSSTPEVRSVTPASTTAPHGMPPRMSSERQRARDDAAIAGLPTPGVDWSPVERRRAMTPTEGRGWTYTPEGMRARAHSLEDP